MTPRVPLELYTRVNAIAAARVAELLQLKRAPERGKYACPVHGGSDSLHAYPGEGRGFYCWGACQRAFSNVDLAAAAWGLAPADAVQRLADTAGVIVPSAPATRPLRSRAGSGRRMGAPAAPPQPSRDPEPVESPDRTAARAALEALSREGHVSSAPAVLYAGTLQQLELGDTGVQYLIARGFDPEAAYRYGFRSIETPASWHRLSDALHASFLSPELVFAGLHRFPWGGRVPALVIPYRYRGRVEGLRFRNLLADADHGARYRDLAGVKPPVPFNADAWDAIEGQDLHIVEGEINAYTLCTYGLRAIGLPGVGAWRDWWADGLRHAARVVAWFDDDPPVRRPDGSDGPGGGAKGRERLAVSLGMAFGRQWLERHACSCTIPRADGRVRDANDLHCEHRLHDLLRAAPWR